MLLKTRYSQETLESFKSIVRDDMRLERITGFISNNAWIYFEPTPMHTLCKLRALLAPVKVSRVRGGWHALISLA